jgi:hypothetical protein
MNRRTLLKLLLTTPIAATLDVEKLLWTPKQMIFIPSPKQVEVFYSSDGGGLICLHGIPYHQSNVGTGTWLGINRGEG